VEGECTRIFDDKLCKTEVRAGNEKTLIVSDYIIAADGVNSRVRTILGINLCQAIFTVSERIDDYHTDCCEFWFGSDHAPGFYSWVFPTAHGASIGTGTVEQGKTNVLMERFKKRRTIEQEGRKRIYRIPVWKGDLYSKGRILFAGDSAGHVLPFTFEGIYYAMNAGELAAQAIIDDKARKYKKMWQDRFQKKFVMMDKLKKFFFKDDASAEKMVALHRSKEVQEASMRLWIEKESSGLGLKEYIKLFGKFLS
jgi:geranylgeranyl reductase